MGTIGGGTSSRAGNFDSAKGLQGAIQRVIEEFDTGTANRYEGKKSPKSGGNSGGPTPTVFGVPRAETVENRKTLFSYHGIRVGYGFRGGQGADHGNAVVIASHDHCELLLDVVYAAHM